MSARFKIVLLVAMAAGIGLHLRPCIGCVIGGLLRGEVRLTVPPAPPAAPAQTVLAATRVGHVAPARPGLSAFLPETPSVGRPR